MSKRPTESDQRPMWVDALLDKDLTPTKFRVWLYLSWRQGRNGSAWPGIQRMAADLGMSESTVRRAIGTLENRGYLTKTTPTRAGRGHTNHYAIKGVTGDTLSAENGVIGDRVSGKKGVTGARERVSPVNAKHNPCNTTHPSLALSSSHGNGPTKPTKAGGTAVLDERFTRFWALWPKRADKADARKVWAKLKPSEELTQTIIAAVKRQKLTEQWAKAGGKYIPGPAKWLRGERWADEIDDAQLMRDADGNPIVEGATYSPSGHLVTRPPTPEQERRLIEMGVIT